MTFRHFRMLIPSKGVALGFIRPSEQKGSMFSTREFTIHGVDDPDRAKAVSLLTQPFGFRLRRVQKTALKIAFF